MTTELNIYSEENVTINERMIVKNRFQSSTFDFRRGKERGRNPGKGGGFLDCVCVFVSTWFVCLT